MNKSREEEKEMYKCQSYYDDDNKLQDCTCGKCGEKSWEKEYNRKYAPLMAKIDEYYWQKGYPKLENDLRKFISQALSSQLKEVLGVAEKYLDPLYFRTLDCTNLDVEPPTTEQGISWEESKKIFIKKLKAEVEKLV